MENNPVNQENQTKETPKKTVDLLFGMKQYKAPEEKQAKKLQQQFAKKRAQHRKRALASISMANFIDQAFGVTQSDIEKQISESEYQLTISTPQVNRLLMQHIPMFDNSFYSSRVCQHRSVN